jgi:putative ABC transport system permease protein
MIVNQATFARLSTVRAPVMVLATVRPGAAPARVRGAVDRALRPWPQAQVDSQAQLRSSVEKQVDQLVYVLYALLAISVLISMFGIANSLTLSVHERTRELALLRAVGALRGQVRRMIGFESAITAAIGGVLGLVVGVLFGWVVTLALADLGVQLSVPVGQLAVLLVIAVVVGVLAATGPARRASRVRLLDALRDE